MDPNIETIKALGDIVGGLTVAGLLWMALYGNLKGWWVSGREHKAKCDDLDKLRSELDAARAHADALAAAAERALDRIAAGDGSGA